MKYNLKIFYLLRVILNLKYVTVSQFSISFQFGKFLKRSCLEIFAFFNSL